MSAESHNGIRHGFDEKTACSCARVWAKTNFSPSAGPVVSGPYRPQPRLARVEGVGYWRSDQRSVWRRWASRLGSSRTAQNATATEAINSKNIR